MKLRFWGCLGVFAVSFLMLSGCGGDPVSPPFSVEEEINANIPYTRITVWIDSQARVFTAGVGGDGIQFESAIAERGLLILTMPYGDKTVYNLSTTNSIDIQDETLILRY
jgi:hypothetical protein